MHAARRSLTYVAFGIAIAAFAGAATAHISDDPLVAILLAAQAAALSAVAWIVLDARRSREEVTTVRAEFAALREQTTEIHDWIKQLDAAPDRAAARPADDFMVARLRKVIHDSGPIPTGLDKESIMAARRISRALNSSTATYGDGGRV